MKRCSFLLTILSLLLFSCSDFNQSIKDTLSNKDSLSTLYKDSIASNNNKIEPKVIPFTSQKDKLLQAEKQLRALPQFAGKPIYIYKLVHFYDDGRIITKLQNPDTPNYIDAYQYEDGKWQDPKPVVLLKNEDIKKNLMNLDRLPFKNVYNVYMVLKEKRKETNSASDDNTIYAFTQNDVVNWYPTSIGNERSNYEIEYKENGTLKSFKQM